MSASVLIEIPNRHMKLSVSCLFFPMWTPHS